jgi:hypothetical protein
MGLTVELRDSAEDVQRDAAHGDAVADGDERVRKLVQKH